MKKLMILLMVAGILKAQSYEVEKISGKVFCFRGTGETIQEVHNGDRLLNSDMLITMENSSVLLKKNERDFLLKSNSALGLNNLKKLSVDELLLALAMEEIRNVPKRKNNREMKSTAVYGTNESEAKNAVGINKGLGEKRINGARQLAENGYKETSVIFARETFRKYPGTKTNTADRIYFAEVLEKLNLFEEAYEEYSMISNLNSSSVDKQLIDARIKNLSAKILKKAEK